MLVFRIAYRNLFRHAGKSLVIGIILLVGSAVMTLGSATLTGMNWGISDGIVNRFMGDITVMSSRQEDEAALFQTMGESPIPISNYLDVKKIIENTENIEKFLPYTVAYLMMLTPTEGPMGLPQGCFVIGADLKKYSEMYEGIEVLTGDPPRKGGRGIYLTTYTQDFYFKLYNEVYYPRSVPLRSHFLPLEARGIKKKNLNLKNDIVLMGVSDKVSTLDIRVPIRGLFRYKRLDNFWKEVNLLDIESYRQCMNYTLGGHDVKLSRKEKAMALVNIKDIDSLFEAGDMLEKPQTRTGSGLNVKSLFQKKSTPSSALSTDRGTFELIAVKIKDKDRMGETIDVLNNHFRENGVDAKAVDWKTAAGMVGYLVTAFRSALFILVAFIFLVAVIIIMNTLAMSILERSAELGTMRALGTQKSFISRMLLTEIFCLSAFFGGLGIIAGRVAGDFLASMELKTKNEFLQLLTGGDVYRPVLSSEDVLSTVLLLAVVTLLSVIYPIRISRKISPMDAIAKD